MASTYRQKFRLLKSDGKPYQLRRREITGMAFYYRQKQENGDQTQQFTRIEQLTIDEVDNSFWVSLPPETLEWYMVLQVEPLRTIQTALQTTTFSIDMAVVETFATPCPLESLQGHSPYIDPLDLYWYQYDDELNCYVNTFIKGSGIIDPTQPIDHPIVDYIAEGTMSAVTSNAVANLRREVINHVSESNMRINNLESKRISVKLNGETHTEDDNGLVDLGEIKTDTYKDDLTMLQQETTLPSGTIVPRGTVVNKDMEVFSLSSPHEFYNQLYNVCGWMYVCYLNGNCQLNVRLNVYNNSYGGTIFVSREGYDYKAVTTSEYLAAHYKILQKGLSAWLVTNGDTHVNKSAHIELVDGNAQFKNYPSKVNDYTALTTKLRELDVFMTSYTEKDDYLTISTNQFETEFDGLEYHTFNLDLTGELDFQFTDEITEPTVLTFVAMHDNTTVKVQDGVGNWAAVSQQLKQGDMAILTWTSPDAYSWSYTTKKEYEITANKVSEINASNSGSTYLYPSLKAITTWVNNNGGKVKSVTANDTQYTPDADGDINIGDVLVPEFELWTAARYDKTSKTTKGEQWSLYDIHTDPLNYSMASETFVRTYVDANNVKTIYLNGQPNVASYGDPTTINLGTLKIKANGIDHQFNGSTCDIGDITGDKLSMSDDDNNYYFTINNTQTQTVSKVKFDADTNTLSIGGDDYTIGGNLPDTLLYKTNNKTIVDGSGINVAYLDNITNYKNFGLFGQSIVKRNTNGTFELFGEQLPIATEYDVQLYLRYYHFNAWEDPDTGDKYDTIQLEDANGGIVNLSDLYWSIVNYNTKSNAKRYVLWADKKRSSESGTRYNRWCPYTLRGWQGGRLVWDAIYSTTDGLTTQADFDADKLKQSRIEFVVQDGDPYTANVHWFTKDLSGADVTQTREYVADEHAEIWTTWLGDSKINKTVVTPNEVDIEVGTGAGQGIMMGDYPSNHVLTIGNHDIIKRDDNSNVWVFGQKLNTGGSSVSYNDGNRVLTIDGTNYQMFKGVQTEPNMYRTWLSDGWIQLPQAKVKIHGKEKDFVVKTGTTYPTVVADLDEVYWNGLFTSDMDRVIRLEMLANTIIEVVADDSIRSFKLSSINSVPVGSNNYVPVKPIYTNGKIQMTNEADRTMVYFNAKTWKLKVLKGRVWVNGVNSGSSVLIDTTVYGSYTIGRDATLPSEDYSVTIGNRWSANGQYGIVWDGSKTPNWQKAANNNIVYVNYWLNNQTFRMVPPYSPLVDQFEKTIKVDNNTDVDRTITFTMPAGTYTYGFTLGKDWDLGTYTIKSGTMRTFNFKWVYENSTNCYWTMV